MRTILAFTGNIDVMFFVLLIVAVLVFFISRALMLWYWRVNTIIENQEEQLTALRAILERLSSKENINV